MSMFFTYNSLETKGEKMSTISAVIV